MMQSQWQKKWISGTSRNAPTSFWKPAWSRCSTQRTSSLSAAGSAVRRTIPSISARGSGLSTGFGGPASTRQRNTHSLLRIHSQISAQWPSCPTLVRALWNAA